MGWWNAGMSLTGVAAVDDEVPYIRRTFSLFTARRG